MLCEIVHNTIRERRNKNIEAMYVEATSVSAAVQYKLTKAGSALAALILFFLNPRRHVRQNTRYWASSLCKNGHWLTKMVESFSRLESSVHRIV